MRLTIKPIRFPEQATYFFYMKVRTIQQAFKPTGADDVTSNPKYGRYSIWRIFIFIKGIFIVCHVLYLKKGLVVLYNTVKSMVLLYSVIDVEC